MMMIIEKCPSRYAHEPEYFCNTEMSGGKLKMHYIDVHDIMTSPQQEQHRTKHLPVWYVQWKRCHKHTTLQKNFNVVYKKNKIHRLHPPPIALENLVNGNRSDDNSAATLSCVHRLTAEHLMPSSHPQLSGGGHEAGGEQGLVSSERAALFFFKWFFCFAFFFYAFLKVALFVQTGGIWQRASLVCFVIHPVRWGTIETRPYEKDLQFRIQVHGLQEETLLQLQTISCSLLLCLP